MAYRAVRLCSSGGGYEALPEGRVSLDLARVRVLLESHGIPVTDARVMLIAEMAPEVTLGRSGRILIKTRELVVAEETLDRFLRLSGLPPRTPSRGRTG